MNNLIIRMLRQTQLWGFKYYFFNFISLVQLDALAQSLKVFCLLLLLLIQLLNDHYRSIMVHGFSFRILLLFFFIFCCLSFASFTLIHYNSRKDKTKPSNVNKFLDGNVFRKEDECISDLTDSIKQINGTEEKKSCLLRIVEKGKF